MSIENKLNYLSETKDLIKQALINKGVEVDDSTPFREYADKVGSIGGKPWNIHINSKDYAVSNINGAIAFSGSKGYFLPIININGKSWELFLKMKRSTVSGTYVSLINDNNHWGSIGIYQYNNNTIGCGLGNGSSWIFDDAMIIAYPVDDDYFFIKYSFDGNNLYELSSYDKDKNLVGHDSITNSYKLSTMNLVPLSSWDFGQNNPYGSLIDLSESYLKVDGEYVQGGV